MAKREQQEKRLPASSGEALDARAGLAKVAVHQRAEQKSDTFLSVYANDVSIQVTPWDMRLTLGTIDSHATPENPIMGILVEAEVRISLPLAKKLAMIMFDQLRSFEEHVGQIPLPKE